MKRKTTIGARVRAARDKRGLSLAQLAAAAGLTRDAIHKIEMGTRRPRGETVAALARALAVTADELLGVSYSDARMPVKPSAGPSDG